MICSYCVKRFNYLDGRGMTQQLADKIAAAEVKYAAADAAAEARRKKSKADS